MKRICKRCEEEKEITEYYKAKGCKDGIRPVCKKCIYKQDLEFKEKNPEHYAARRRHAGLRYLYGIGEKEYDKMKEDQGSCCAICLEHESDLNKRLVVDHCHTTNKVRGLLCDSCNVGLGRFKDDNESLFAAAQYILEYKE